MRPFDDNPWNVRRLRVVRMRDFGFAGREIAVLLGISTDRVYQLERRGRWLLDQERRTDHVAAAGLEVLVWAQDKGHPSKGREQHALAAVKLLAGLKVS